MPVDLIDYLSQDITVIKGIGEKISEHFYRLKIITIRDLILHTPYAAERKIIYHSNMDLAENITYIIKLKIIETNEVHNRFMFKALTQDNKSIDIVYFNFKPYFLLNKLKTETTYIFVGKIKKFMDKWQIAHPEIFSLTQQNIINEIEPKYQLTYGLNSSMIHKFVATALERFINFPEWIPNLILKNRKLPSFMDALTNLHYLSKFNQQTYNLSLQRIALDEVLYKQISLYKLRGEIYYSKKIKINITSENINKINSYLPFELTNCQQKAIREIISDLESDKKMLRLIQGDVGAGKTMVAFYVMFLAALDGFQAALLAPTDILSQQHYEGILPLAEKLGLKVVLLKSALKAKEKREALAKIENGEASIIIGTHAIIQNTVNFHMLKLAIIDEQHRFGVLQRQTLLHKGEDVELLLMSATPIPRTMLLAAFGDVDCSTIITKPAGRKEIINSLKSHKSVEEIAYSLTKILKNNQKIYWICSLIEENEDETTIKPTSVIERYNYLRQIYPKITTLVHGQLSSEEKQHNMDKFANDPNTQIMVATTVIEVGVDVRNATLIVIENAEKFGIAQLHQLRGRVGRSDLQSYCILIYGAQFSKKAQEKLKILKNSNDGFYLAEKDLELRGGGDIAGINQSGGENFKYLNIFAHQEQIEIAKNLSTHYNDLKNINYLHAIFDNYLNSFA